MRYTDGQTDSEVLAIGSRFYLTTAKPKEGFEQSVVLFNGTRL